jgi:hypothetical protein
MSSSRQGNYPTHLIVQRLNSRGAFYIERGEHDKAINVLVKALKLWETVDEAEISSCCSIDECILQARHLSPQAIFNRNQASSKQASHGDSEQERFIYRQPIVTTGHFLRKDHAPGNTLSLIIILNLAMAHHLSAIENGLCRRRLQKGLHLYELAHQLQMDEGICSPQATMIIANNVGEIHRAVNNHSKHAMCLQHLLSTMMYMVDNQATENTAEWDGFLRNTSQLILHNNCAGAA